MKIVLRPSVCHRSLVVAACFALTSLHTPAFAQPPIPYAADSVTVRGLWPALSCLRFEGGAVYADLQAATVINRQRGKFPTGDMLYNDDPFVANDIVLLRTRLRAEDAIQYFVVFTEGGSHDPMFYFIPDTASAGAYTASVPAEVLIMPGHGMLYTLGHANRTFRMRQKYALKGSRFVEVSQPYYAVGMTSKAMVPLKLTSQPGGGTLVAELPRGSPVEILLSDDKESNDFTRSYLARTPFGLVGWITVQIHQEADVLEGIFFEGD